MLHSKAVCSNPRHKREKFVRLTSDHSRPNELRQAPFGNPSTDATNSRDRTKKGSRSTDVAAHFGRKEHPINLQWTLKGTCES